jgi:hypothetical protein
MIRSERVQDSVTLLRGTDRVLGQPLRQVVLRPSLLRLLCNWLGGVPGVGKENSVREHCSAHCLFCASELGGIAERNAQKTVLRIPSTKSNGNRE